MGPGGRTEKPDNNLMHCIMADHSYNQVTWPHTNQVETIQLQGHHLIFIYLFKSLTMYLRNLYSKARVMAQTLRALTSLPENLGSIPSKEKKISYRGSSISYCLPWTAVSNAMNKDTCRQSVCRTQQNTGGKETYPNMMLLLTEKIIHFWSFKLFFYLP